MSGDEPTPHQPSPDSLPSILINAAYDGYLQYVGSQSGQVAHNLQHAVFQRSTAPMNIQMSQPIDFTLTPNMPHDPTQYPAVQPQQAGSNVTMDSTYYTQNAPPNDSMDLAMHLHSGTNHQPVDTNAVPTNSWSECEDPADNPADWPGNQDHFDPLLPQFETGNGGFQNDVGYEVEDDSGDFNHLG